MEKVINVLLGGVGGQGAVLASKILSQAALQQGYDVKVSEVHGMAQRGGSVTTQVRIGEKVWSPLIKKGEADYLIAFEKLEALRWLDYLKPEGVLIVSDQSIQPMSVIMGKAHYPENITDYLCRAIPRTIAIDALSVAAACGSSKAVNVVLIGILAAQMPFAKEIWLEALRLKVPEKYLDINLQAFEEGYKQRLQQ